MIICVILIKLLWNGDRFFVKAAAVNCIIKMVEFMYARIAVRKRWMTLELLNHTFDLHNSEYVEGNIMTEYETRFVEKGNAICRMELKQK